MTLLRNMLAVVAVGIFASGNALGAKRFDADDYLGLSTPKLLHCKLSFDMFQMTRTEEHQSEYKDCIAKTKTDMQANFSKALGTVTKPKARDALKEYQVAIMMALDGIEPGDNERKIEYERRQQKLSDKIREARARFDIER